MFTSSSSNNNNNNNNNNSCVDNNMVVDGDEHQTMFDNRSFENDISPSYKLDNLSLSFFHFSPATFLDQDDAYFQYHSQLLQSVVGVDSPTDSITTTLMAAADQDQQTQQTTKLMATDDDNDPASSSKFDLPNNNNNNKVKTKSSSSSSTSTRKTPKRRVSGKKDRHSKIVTAQGTRDRRMRLSLPIAREFFSLQDMLGVDKPSKTVQWLLTMSKSAIEELTSISTLSHRRRNNISNKQYHTAGGTGGRASNCKSTTTGSSMSDCEVVSEIEETVITCNIQEQSTTRRRSVDFSKRKSLESTSPSTTTSNKGKKMKPSPPSPPSPPRKITYHHPLTRESRAKARARARARTIEKMQGQRRFIDNSKQCVRGQNLNNDLKKVRTSLTSSTTSKESEESAGSGTYDMKSTLKEMVSSTDEVMKYSSPSTDHQAGGLVKDNINVDLEEESFMITTRKAISSSSIFSYHDDIGLIASNNNSNNSTSVLNFSEMWDFFDHQ